MRDARYVVMGYLLSNLDENGGIEITVCEGSEILRIERNNFRNGAGVCYVGADEWTLKNGNVVVLGAGTLRNDVERCLANGGYNVIL